MKIINRYIARTVLSSIALVTLVLMALEMFILFVAELDNLGQGDYNFGSALVYVLLQMPYQVYLFFPVATLLGCLIGLGTLASSSELIAMRAAGTTVFQIIMAVWMGAVVLVIGVSVFGETVMPHWVRMSLERKMTLTSGGQAVRTQYGTWLKKDNNFIHVDEILPDYHLKQVQQYQFDAEHHLTLSRSIQDIEYINGQWMMFNMKESRLSKTHIKTDEVAQAPWDVNLSVGLLGLTNVQPDEMNLRELHHYIEIERQEHQLLGNYELAYWQRWFQPIVSGIMIFLAIPCIFGPLRESSTGARIVLGTMFGFGFHMLNKFFGSASLVYQFSPIIGAAGPSIVFILIAIWMMRRVR